MPLLRRRPVQLLPLPDLTGLAKDAPVFYLKATGEVFLDYEQYAARLSFLLLRQFQCEYSGKTNLDYFSALQSEKAESKVVRERFPDELKGRVLATVQFRVMGRLDALVDLVYERYKDRFYTNEKIFVDLSGDKYFAKIARVFPPSNIRSQLPSPSTPSTSTAPPGEVDYSSLAHKLGVDLNVDPKQARAGDDPDEYLYTVQLMDEEHKFEGSFMEVSCKSLSRDRLAFSKSILKRYLRECLMRDPAIGSPWMVKPSLARQFDIASVQSEGELERNAKAKEGKLAKRRKTVGGEDGDGEDAEGGEGKSGKGAKGKGKGTPEPAAKRRKTADSSTPAPTPSAPVASTSAAHSPPAASKPKTIKYPIEDLELEAMSIHDGRILRRVNSELPTLPKKPQPRRVSESQGLEGVPEECVDRLLETWNMLNVFSKPLFLTAFSLDDYAAALQHSTLSPRCVLLLEIHASLTNIIGTDNSRVLGSTSAVYAHGPGGVGRSKAAAAATKRAEEEGGTPQPKQEEGDETPAPAPADPNVADDPAAQHQLDLQLYEASELNQLVRLGVSYGKRWDRQAKLKYAEGREGWERHLIGALCQRGGPVYLEGFVRIMRHLFEGSPRLPRPDGEVGGEEEGAAEEGKEEEGVENGEVKKEEGVEGEEQKPAVAAKEDVKPKPKPENGGGAAEGGEDGDEEDDDPTLAEDTSNPEQAYLSLPLADKLEIINYLCTLVMGSKAVRNYVDECDAKLTELRKVRAEVNKERKALFEQKTNLEQGRDTPSTPTGAGISAGLSALAAPSPLGASAPATANGNGSLSAMDVDSPAPSVAGGLDDEEDQLASDTESTVAPSEAGSTISRSKQQQGSSSSVAGLAQLREAARAKTKGVIARSTIEDKLKTNSDKDDELEREFRRFQGVQRCRPLGKDRFHCRYWWFDGVGGMDLVRPASEGGGVVYGTGRLFVQGPSQEDWDMIADVRGVEGEKSEKEMRRRRVEEEVVEPGDARGLLEPGEWGFYEEDDEIEALQHWLNNKGTRELALKTSLQKWRTLIISGAQKRQFDAANPDVPRYDTPANSGRRSRAKAEPELLNNYMGYRNPAHKY